MSPETWTALGNAIWCTWLELSLWLMVGVFAAGAMHVFLPAHLIQRQLSGRWGPLRAVLFGIPLPLCSCGVIPAAMQLKKDGAEDGSVLGFLIATPQTGVDSVFASASLLGWPFAWFKVVSALLMGLVGGYGLRRAQDGQGEIRTEVDVSSCGHDHHHHHGHGHRHGHGHSHAITASSRWTERLPEAWRFVVELVDNLAGWLVVGVLISAALDVLVPKAVFVTLAQWGTVSVTVAVLALSLPLYVCATASVPIAASLVAQGLPLGAALVFLMAGPATNVATMGALYRSIGVRALGWYLGTIILGSVSMAYLLDQQLGWVPALNVGHVHDMEGSLLESACAILLAVWVAYCLYGRLQNYLMRGNTKAQEGTPYILWVGGMTCGGCVRGLSNKLRGVSGVEQLNVDLETGRVEIRGAVSRAALEETVIKAGFELLEAPECEHEHDACGHSHSH